MTRLSNRYIGKSNARTAYFPLTGGLNTEDPALTLEPGELIATVNYEVGIRGRYRRCDGYERDDGRALPSSLSYYRMSYDTGVYAGAFSSGFSSGFDPARTDLVGAVCTGGTSGATGIVVKHYEAVSSRDGAGSGYVIMAQVSDTSFQMGEAITITINIGFSAGFSNGFQ